MANDGVGIQLDGDDLFVLANKTNAVRAGIERRAANVATRARRQLKKTGVDATVKITDHPIASGRTSRDVAVTADEKNIRRAARIVRRAAREVRR